MPFIAIYNNTLEDDQMGSKVISALFELNSPILVDKISNSKKTRESGVTCYVLGVRCYD